MSINPPVTCFSAICHPPRTVHGLSAPTRHTSRFPSTRQRYSLRLRPHPADAKTVDSNTKPADKKQVAGCCYVACRFNCIHFAPPNTSAYQPSAPHVTGAESCGTFVGGRTSEESIVQRPAVIAMWGESG